MRTIQLNEFLDIKMMMHNIKGVYQVQLEKDCLNDEIKNDTIVDRNNIIKIVIIKYALKTLRLFVIMVFIIVIMVIITVINVIITVIMVIITVIIVQTLWTMRGR